MGGSASEKIDPATTSLVRGAGGWRSILEIPDAQEAQLQKNGF